MAAMASWRERRRKLTEFRKSTRIRLFGLLRLRGKWGIEERVRHRTALVLTDRQVAEQREKLRDDYRREVGDARRHWPWQGWSG